VNRLATRLLLAMLVVTLVSLTIVPLTQVVATIVTFNRLPTAFRARVIERSSPPPLFRTPSENSEYRSAFIRNRVDEEQRTVVIRPSAGEPGTQDLHEENSRLFALLSDFRATLQLAAAGGTAVALLLSIALALWLSRSIARPIEAVSAAASRLASGAFTTRVTLGGRQLGSKEAAALAHDFNAMAESLERYEGERKAMIADIAHELRTPLATLQLRLEALRDGLVSFGPAEADLLLDHAGLLARLIDDLRLMSMADTGRLMLDRRKLDLASWLAQIDRSFQDTARSRQLSFQVDPLARPLWVEADPQRLAQILHNLIDNALKATPAEGSVTIRAGVLGGFAQLSVRDSGPGVPDGELDTIFERFVQGRRRDSGEQAGIGLGLSIARMLARLHGGDVTARNHRDGAEFLVTLPLWREHPEQPADEENDS
jgi:two-component system sensor histidine kinase BaeS